MLDLDDWDFDLPDHHIARHPAARRDGSRLLHVPLADDVCGHHCFEALPTLLRPGDLLVVNDSRVLAARLRARRATGGKVELLVLGLGDDDVVPVLAKPARRLKLGETLDVDGGSATIVALADDDGVLRVRLSPDPLTLMDGAGELPLPPYLGRTEEPSDRERYQTVYAQTPGSSAAPTAGLHFTPGLLDTLRAGGVRVATVTLHVGLGTFRPLRSEDLDRGTLHTERIVLPEETARAVDETRRVGGRVVAVGTTSARTLEARADGRGGVLAGSGSTDLFLHPPMRPEVIDGLITNFHLPRSSLLMLVATLVGRERLLQTYELAKAEGYRFYSYGDAMLLL